MPRLRRDRFPPEAGVHVSLDKTRVLRRKKRARTVLLVVLLVGVSALAAVSWLMRGKDRLISAKIDAALAVVEHKTGLHITYESFTTNMTSSASFAGVRVTMKDGAVGAETTLAELGRVDLEFELGNSTAAPARLRQVTLIAPKGTIELGEDGKPRLPAPLLERVGRLTHADLDLPAPGDNGNGNGNGGPTGRMDPEVLMRAAMSSLLGFEVNLRDGALKFIDRHYAKAGPGTLETRDVSGRVFIDLLRRRLDTDIEGLVVGGGGAFELRAMVKDDVRFFELRGKDLSLSPVAPYLSRRVHVGEETRLDGRVSITLESDARVLPVDFDGELRNLYLEDPRLASAPIRDVSVRAVGRVVVDPVRRFVEVPQARILMGRAHMDAVCRVEFPEGRKPVVDLSLQSKELPIQAALDALPKDFAPKLQGAEVEGRMSLRVDLNVDLNDPNATVFEPSVEVTDFHVITPPPEANVLALNAPFEHKIYKNGQYVKTITVGPSNPDFVSYNDLGRVLVGAVLTCEDGSFFRHNGFAMRHIMDSIRTNIRQERFARGASTVTMQTAKNLFLGGEKTASRKFQEMLVTWWLEEELPKERILEIYMNIIEWGPKLYGVGPAARHYFGRKPKDLSPLQAAYLGSIISNPVGYYRFYERGYAGNGATLAFILRKMAERGAIPAEMVEWCDPYRPSFSKDGKPAAGGCVKPPEDEEGEAIGDAKLKPAPVDEPVPPPEDEPAPGSSATGD